MSRAKGNIAEECAAIFLHDSGFSVLERNFYTRFGEVDIVAQRDGVIHFVEVKSGEGFEPVYNITPRKLSRVIKSAQSYMKQKRLDCPYCIDALILKGKKIEFIENITV